MALNDKIKRNYHYSAFDNKKGNVEGEIMAFSEGGAFQELLYMGLSPWNVVLHPIIEPSSPDVSIESVKIHEQPKEPENEYSYCAVTLNGRGEAVYNHLLAKDKEEALSKIREMGYLPTSVWKSSSIEPIKIYAVRNNFGKWLKGQTIGKNDNWVESLKEAKIWRKISQARARVTFWAEHCPDQGIPEIVEFEFSEFKIIDETKRIEKKKTKKIKEKAKADYLLAKKNLEEAIKKVEEASENFKRIR